MKTTTPTPRKFMKNLHHLLVVAMKSIFRVFFDFVYEYATAHTDTAAYFIGGGPRYMETIAEFKNYRWSNFGKLYRRDFKHFSNASDWLMSNVL